MSESKSVSKGALPSQALRSLLKEGTIKGADESQISPSSLDLTISDEVYRVERLFLPDGNETVRSLLKGIGATKHDLNAPMERGVSYLAKLNETVELPKDMYGFCNPKSSTGRNDIHVRIVADGVSRYDVISKGWKGELWLALTPRSYPVIAPEGFSFSQLRLFTGDMRLSEEEIQDCFKNDPLLYTMDNRAIPYDDMKVHNSDGSVTLTIDLQSDIIGYECFEPGAVLDLGKMKHYDLSDFFTPLYKSDSLVLREGHFYILSSLEKVRVPSHLALEMKPMDERYGDFRSHYAGFIDPGWGWGKKGEGTGRTLTLEVRPFENLEVRHGQAIARVQYERVTEVPDLLYDARGDANYTVQHGPKLAKQFKV